MRIIKKSIKKWGQGYVVLIPTDDEDLWHIYNLIQVDDHIKMKSPRKIVNVNETGLKNIKVKKLTLMLQIVDIDYFSQGDRLAISVKGRNAQENQYLKLGQYHTFCVELNLKITIYKNVWPQFECNLLREISSTSHNVEIAAMVMQEGVAHLCYVKPSITLLAHKIEKNVSKKSSGQQVHTKSLNKFFLDCYRAIRSIDMAKIKCFVIASPGFINQQLLKYINDQVEKENDKLFRKSIQKFMLVKCSNGYMQSLNEVLADPRVMSKMENTKAINQSKVLEKFYAVMMKNQNLVAYGEKEVFRCIEMRAVETLLIGDFLFRTKNLKKRVVFNKIVDQVRGYGAEAVIFSTLHPSGEKLKSITGIAAILKFQVIPEDDDDEVPEEKAEESDKVNQEEMVKQFKALQAISDDDEDSSDGDKGEQRMIEIE